MIKGKKIIAIIPARGGSKGLPGKNLKPLCGKPLIAWTIEQAIASTYIDEVMVTTDDKKIGAFSKKYGANVPFLRPTELASDVATTFDVVKHTIDYYENFLKQNFDYVVLLEPTSPIRENNDIDSMIETLESNSTNYDSIISIGEISEHPAIVKKISDGMLIPFYHEISLTTRRQDNLPAYFPYGVAYIAKLGNLLIERTFYCKRSTYYRIKRHQNYEIDDIYDFICIEAILKYLKGSQ